MKKKKKKDNLVLPSHEEVYRDWKRKLHVRQFVGLKRSIRIWDFRSERPRESVNPSAPNKFIWESLRRAEHFSSM